MHGATFPLTETSGFSIQLRHHGINIGSLCNDMTMPPVGSIDIVIGTEIQADASSDGFLADRKMNRLGRQVSLAKGLGQMIFKMTNGQHCPQNI